MLTQPISQVRLTNVALIKYKLHNKKFEIACYKNKAINWRNGIEKDIDEVLQSNQIFTNASQGHLASKEELKSYFPGMETREILKTILDNGELQISDKERESNLNNIFKDIANIITEKCVHSISKRPISIDSVGQAIKDIHFPIKLDQSSKKQALRCMKQLMRKFLIARAEMKIEITCLSSNKEKLFKELEKIGVNPPSNKDSTNIVEDTLHIFLLIEPAKYREIDNIFKSILKEGNVQVIIPYVANKEVTDIESAGTVNLELRPDYKEGDELKEDSDEDSDEIEKESSKKKKNKKKKGSDKNKEEKKENFKDENEVNQKHSKSKNKKTKKNKENPAEISDVKNSQKSEEKKIEEPVNKNENLKKDVSSKPGLKCLSCKGALFEDNSSFRNHFKSEWHNFNLKRKIDKLESLSEEEFKVFELDKEFVKEKN